MIALSFLGVLSKRLNSMKKLLGCSFVFILNLPFFASAGIINFGSADEYIIATASNNQWGGNLLLGSDAHIFGSVAASNTLYLGDGVIIDGNACAGKTESWGTTVISTPATCNNLTDLANDITSAADQAQTYNAGTKSDIIGSNNFSGAGTQSFSINKLLLSSGDTLTVNGGINDSFIFNVFEQALLGSGANILLEGGIKSENVIFNFVANSVNHTFEVGGANISGTFLSSGRTFILGDGATLNNSRFYSTEAIVGNVQDVRFPTNASTPVPEPTTLAIFVLGMIGLVSRKLTLQN
jgi:hypothetical protein